MTLGAVQGFGLNRCTIGLVQLMLSLVDRDVANYARMIASAPSTRTVATLPFHWLVARMFKYSPLADHAMRVLGVMLLSLTSRGIVQQGAPKLAWSPG
jgi:hypothetical protein